jgi:uncharacterized protein YfiM (DUF2279 family)
MNCKRIVLFLAILISSTVGHTQDTAIYSKDSSILIVDSLQPRYNLKKIRTVTAVSAVAYATAIVALYQTWYKDYQKTTFHFFNDNGEWNQMDKVGHAYTAYAESRINMEMWRYAGLSTNKRIWVSGLSAVTYQTAIEAFDGFYAGWGWSWGDFAANIVGSGMMMSQELGWNEQRILFKFSFHTKNYGAPVLNERADDLYGRSLPERMLKDYNGQTYWLSANIHSFFPQSSLPAWLNVAVGYGADGLFGGDKNKWTNANGITYDATNIERTRQFYLAPDIDLTRIKTKSKLLKVLFFSLNAFKFPAPSLELSNGKMKFNWVHF